MSCVLLLAPCKKCLLAITLLAACCRYTRDNIPEHLAKHQSQLSKQRQVCS